MGWLLPCSGCPGRAEAPSVGLGHRRGDPCATAPGGEGKGRATSPLSTAVAAVLELCKAKLCAHRGLSPWLLLRQKGALSSAHKHLPQHSQHPASPSHGQPETILNTCTGEFSPLPLGQSFQVTLYCCKYFSGSAQPGSADRDGFSSVLPETD